MKLNIKNFGIVVFFVMETIIILIKIVRILKEWVIEMKSRFSFRSRNYFNFKRITKVRV